MIQSDYSNSGIGYVGPAPKTLDAARELLGLPPEGTPNPHAPGYIPPPPPTFNYEYGGLTPVPSPHNPGKRY